jgi:hypothetical protein
MLKGFTDKTKLERCGVKFFATGIASIPGPNLKSNCVVEYIDPWGLYCCEIRSPEEIKTFNLARIDLEILQRAILEAETRMKDAC